MTKHEMRQRLAEAMGWTEIRDIPAGGLVGVPPGGGGALTPIPNPLGYDDDAARLRAWCVGHMKEYKTWEGLADAWAKT